MSAMLPPPTRNQVLAELAIATALELLSIGIRGFRGEEITAEEEKAIHDAVNANAVRLAAAAMAKEGPDEDGAR